ncbi:hypothetical protein Tco_1132429 [Tanacetum coccineum]|uniref:Integrase, catalytic region, zinc finger, CCHC-type, peptidase aspartic, catalytic n=1 Tax=Tanacetum coccineum TaxID=301880 RepID=A0ABQ5JET6_9ASTR
MANLLEDIQCASSDTRPPMLDRTDFASWQQRIRLYCRGKENGVNILKSRTVYSDLSPKDKERYNADIRATNILLQGMPKDIYSLINHYIDAKDIWDNVKMLLEGSELTKEEDVIPQCMVTLKLFSQNKGETFNDYFVLVGGLCIKLINDMRNIKMTMSRMQLNSKFVNNMLPEWGRFVTTVKLNKGLMESNYDQLTSSRNGTKAIVHDGRVVASECSGSTGIEVSGNLPGRWLQMVMGVTERVGMLIQCQAGRLSGQDNTINEDVDEQPVQDLALNVDNVFQADNCDAFDSDVDEAPMAYTMFMANLSSADPVYDEDGLSYDSDILSKVHDHDHYQDAVCEHHEEHEMHDDVQPNYVVDSHANYTSDSNMILYEQYIKDNAVPVIQSNVSSVPNDAYMMIFNDMHEPHAHPVSVTTRNTVVNNSLTAELATYKEQVKLYERRARFELTEREQKIDEQLRIVIADRNIKEETLKKEFTYVKMNLLPTFNHNKSYGRRMLLNVRGKGVLEQTRNGYLSEGIRFFKTLKEHFEVIQKALTKEIKEMKDVFEELEAEVDQNFVDKKHDEIEQKNLLIAHDNLIVNCLSKEVFYVAMNSELNVYRFTENA